MAPILDARRIGLEMEGCAMIYLRLTWAIVSFITCMVLKLVLLDFPGLFLVPIGIWFGKLRINPVAPWEVFNPPDWLMLYGNWEEGYDAPKSYTLYPGASDFWRRYQWAALRNRTDNLQFTWFCPPPVPGKVKVEYLSTGGFICWQGWRHYVWTPLGKSGRAISFGWNYYPTDNAPLEPHDPRRYGCAFGGRYTPKGGHLT
jgi:hypothetical protein